MATDLRPDPTAAGTFTIGRDGDDPLTGHRMGYGAMRLTGEGVWGPPDDRQEARRVLRRAVELGIDFIDTAGHLEENTAAATLELDDEDLQALAEVTAE